jgi:lipoprotein-anchoring transpeptidase ErfK/SrfK
MPLTTSSLLRCCLVAAALGLSACTIEGLPTGTSTSTPAAKAPTVPAAEQIYVSSMDSGFEIPAVPLEKLPEGLRRQMVEYPNTEVPGTIIVAPGQKVLYYVVDAKQAIRYGIAVGRAGFEWAGEANVDQVRPWPTWTPPPEMIERKPELKEWEKGQPGGPTNPLGARAIYLLSDGRDYGYRIHGTPEWWSIGSNASSGCIRMINQDVLDLSARVQPGAKVVVLKADGTRTASLIVPPPAPPKKKPVHAPAPTPAPVVAPIDPVMPDLPPPPPLDPDLIAPVPA